MRYTEADYVRALRLCQDHDPHLDEIAQALADIRNEERDRCARLASEWCPGCSADGRDCIGQRILRGEEPGDWTPGEIHVGVHENAAKRMLARVEKAEARVRELEAELGVESDAERADRLGLHSSVHSQTDKSGTE